MTTRRAPPESLRSDRGIRKGCTESAGVDDGEFVGAVAGAGANERIHQRDLPCMLGAGTTIAGRASARRRRGRRASLRADGDIEADRRLEAIERCRFVSVSKSCCSAVAPM